ncbi:MAG: prepilin peptidase, partial [bacterium]|nr:prepilin peptidase [bacterium]
MVFYTVVLISLFSACIGSFLNVCIDRLPRGRSVIVPRSYCPRCGRTLKWFHNIPLFSFIFLKGRCAFCQEKIGGRQLFVELLTIGLALSTFAHFGLTPSFFLYFLFLICPLIVVSFIDLQHLIIPDLLTLPGIPVGVIVSLLLSPEGYGTALKESLFGILVGGGFLFLVGFLSEKIRGQEGLGGGDVKLA